MKMIPLTQNQYSSVSDEDYDRVMQHKWHVVWMRDRFRAYRNLPNRGSGQSLASFIMNVTSDVMIDHIDGNTLNDQRSNLRIATSAQNNQNSSKRSGTSSQYKGVSWHRKGRKWVSQICAYGTRHYLGFFTTEREAAIAYDSAARKYFGEFAKLNFPNGVTP